MDICSLPKRLSIYYLHNLHFQLLMLQSSKLSFPPSLAKPGTKVVLSSVFLKELCLYIVLLIIPLIENTIPSVCINLKYVPIVKLKFIMLKSNIFLFYFLKLIIAIYQFIHYVTTCKLYLLILLSLTAGI